MPANRRSDLDNRTIALKWISGETIDEIAIELKAGRQTISRRLAEARISYPELSWGERDRGGLGKYVRMSDGKPGISRIPQGSVINSRENRGR